MLRDCDDEDIRNKVLDMVLPLCIGVIVGVSLTALIFSDLVLGIVL